MSNLLAHRAGLPCVEQQLTIDDVYDWNKMTSLLATQKPYWEPGSAHGYHSYTMGFLAGELIQRVDPQHRSYSQFVRDELDPEFYVGVPDDKVEARVAPLIGKEVRKGILTPCTKEQFSERNTLRKVSCIVVVDKDCKYRKKRMS